MSNLTLRGTTLDHADLRRKEASVFVRGHFSCDLSNPVIEAMEWQEIPSCVGAADLEGFLTCDKIIMTPADKKLKDQEIELPCSRIEAFKITRKVVDEKTITRLRFTALLEQEGTAAYLENWLKIIGGAECSMKVTYHDQEKLDMQEGPKATDEQRAAAMEIPTGKGARAN